MTDRTTVAWDIETTGFAVDDRITVTGFWFPAGHTTLVVNLDSRSDDTPIERIATRLEDHLETVSDVPVSIRPAPDERTLIETIPEVCFERFDREYNRLVAFNAESWQGGFDLPFLRTRCLRQDIEWVFDGIEFADLWDPLQKRLNTTHRTFDTDCSIESLVGSYDRLVDQDTGRPCPSDTDVPCPRYADNRYDPFVDSREAVTAYERGEFEAVCRHNLADIHRTWELAQIVDEYVPASDWRSKRL